MSTDASAFVNNASKKEVVDAVERGQKAESRLARAEMSRKQLAIATAGMGAEAVGAIAGGVVVGYLQANDYEEWAGLVAAGLGVGMGMKRLEDPTNPYYHTGFAAATGIGAALAAGYARDYFSQGKNPAMT